MLELADEKELDAFTASGLAVVDFYAAWCGPCRALAPVLVRCSHRLPAAKFARINSDGAEAACAKHRVEFLPTVIVFRDGRECRRFVGAVAEGDILNAISG